MDRITARLLEQTKQLKQNIANTNKVIENTRQEMAESKERDLAMIQKGNERKAQHKKDNEA
jgi:hypothetical protein